MCNAPCLVPRSALNHVLMVKKMVHQCTRKPAHEGKRPDLRFQTVKRKERYNNAEENQLTENERAEKAKNCCRTCGRGRASEKPERNSSRGPVGGWGVRPCGAAVARGKKGRVPNNYPGTTGYHLALLYMYIYIYVYIYMFLRSYNNHLTT